jgi:hypothetical protein
MSELLDRVVKAHGGIERWNQIRSIDLKWNFSGSLLTLKGYPGHYQPTITVETKEPRAVLQRLGNVGPDDRCHLDWDRTWIDKRNGSIENDRAESRASFAGHTRPTPWDQLHLTYFVGYALWNYLCTPFIFTWPGFSSQELDIHLEAGQTWRVLEVTYPEGFPTHTRVQKFYFDDQEYFLRRLDYITDVAGGVVAHYCYDHKEFGGIIFPTLRRVVRREADGSTKLHGSTSFILDYVEVVVNDA